MGAERSRASQCPSLPRLHPASTHRRNFRHPDSSEGLSLRHLMTPGGFIFWGRWNKAPRTGWLRTTEIYSLIVQETSIQVVSGTGFFWRRLGKIYPQPLSHNPCVPRIIDASPDPCLCRHVMFSLGSLCIFSFSVSCKDTGR